MSDRLTRAQREALALLERHRYEGPAEKRGHYPEGFTSSETYWDAAGPAIHWRTAISLEKLGYVTIGPHWQRNDGGYSQDIFLTGKR